MKNNAINFILLIILNSLHSQTVFNDDITFLLGDFQYSGISVGNPCGVPNRIVANVYSDMNMNNSLKDYKTFCCKDDFYVKSRANFRCKKCDKDVTIEVMFFVQAVSE